MAGYRSAELARVEPRMPVLLAAELRSETSRTRCRVIDLSRGGACVELDGPMAPGREITLHSGTMQARGKVVWLDGRRCGVRFAQPIRATELLVQMSQSRKTQAKPEAVPLNGGARSPSLSI